MSARLAAAQETIDAAERIDVTLTTEKLPSGVTGLLSAEGFGNRTPAFSGQVTVVTGGASLDADVVAVDGQVYAKTSFAPVFLSIDPKTLGAPDPADLIGTSGEGLSSVLTATKPTGSDRTREGSDVLTTISGTIPGSTVANLLTTASDTGTFKVTYTLEDDDVLRSAKITGPFYRGKANVTYVLTLKASDEPADISKP